MEEYKSFELDYTLPDAPWGYDKDHIVLLPKDPYWIYAYWEITDEKKNHCYSLIHPERAQDFTWALKLNHSGAVNGSIIQDRYITVGEHSRACYIHTESPDSRLRVEYGLLSPYNDFIPVLASNEIYSPRDRESDNDWVYYANIFDKNSLKRKSSSSKKSINHSYGFGSEEFLGPSSYNLFSQFS